MRYGFKACYTHALSQDPKANGKVSVTITIGTNGDVTQVDAKASGNLPASVEPCIRKQVRGAHFDPPQGGPATVRIPLVFAHI